MSMDKRRIRRNDQTSDGPCFSSNYNASGRFPKMSIGVTVEASTRKKPQANREGEAQISVTQKVDSRSVIPSSREGKTVTENRGVGAILDEREPGPFLFPRTRWKGKNENEIVVSAMEKVGSRSLPPPTIEVKAMREGKGVNIALDEQKGEVPNQHLLQGMKSVQFNSNQTSVVQSENSFHHKFDWVTYGRKSKTDGVEEDLAFAAKQEMHVLGKRVDGEKPEGTLQQQVVLEVKQSHKNLRTKLLGVLESVPSQNEKNHSPTILKSYNGHLEATTVKLKQNSDTIETDSESLNKTVKRPVTRSVTQKKLQCSMPKLRYEINTAHFLASSSYSRPNHQDKNVFSFNEIEGRGTFTWPVNERSSLLNNNSEKKNTQSEPRRNSLPTKTFAGKILNASGKENTPPPPAEKKTMKDLCSSVLQNKTKDSFSSKLQQYGSPQEELKNPSSHKTKDSFPSKLQQYRCPQEEPKNPPSPKSTIPRNLYSPLLDKNTLRDEGFQSPMAPKITNSQEVIRNPPLRKNPVPKEDFHSPILPKKTFTEDYFHGSPPPKDTAMKENFLSPDPDANRRFKAKGFHSMRTFQTSKAGCSSPPKDPARKESFLSPDPDANRRFKLEAFHSMRTAQTSKAGCSRLDIPTESSDDAGELESSGRASPLVENKDARNTLLQLSMEGQDLESPECHEDKGLKKEKWSPASPENPAFTLRRNKRLHDEGTVDVNRLQGALHETQEDGLAGAINQFALVLESFKTKMKSQTIKKSSEILASAAVNINKQLQDFESRIQTDVGKFAGLSKAKRKHRELRFQEHQERLKIIHNKFKEEVNQHLQDCRSMLEELEADQIELSRTAEKQNASHRKLILQVEESIKAQLADADKSIAATHEESRKRMKSLKHLVGDCLKEGSLA